MTYATSWHCSGTLVTTVFTEDCNVTATSSDSSLGSTTVITSTSSPLFIQDSGNLTLGLGILITLNGIIFMGLVFGIFGMKKS